MSVVRWEFLDTSYATPVSYEFEINPNQGGLPQRKKNIQYQKTIAPDGKTLIFEGADEPMTLEWSGTILSQEHHETFQEWHDKRHQIQLTDDLGNVTFIYITSYEPKRERAYSHPWKISYTMRATVLDWPS